MIKISCKLLQTKKSFIPLIQGIRSWIVKLSHLLHNHDVMAAQLGKSDSHSNLNPFYCCDMLSVAANYSNARSVKLKWRLVAYFE